MRVVQRSFPSETETFGNAVVEAQAAGLPVIVAPGRAPSENVREGETALLAGPSQPFAVAAAVRTLLASHALRAHGAGGGAFRARALSRG